MKQKYEIKDKSLQVFEYTIVHSYSMGYCVMKRQKGFWQQITKWYTYYGNLKRYNKCANEPALYRIMH